MYEAFLILLGGVVSIVVALALLRFIARQPAGQVPLNERER